MVYAAIAMKLHCCPETDKNTSLIHSITLGDMGTAVYFELVPHTLSCWICNWNSPKQKYCSFIYKENIVGYVF